MARSGGIRLQTTQAIRPARVQPSHVRRQVDHGRAPVHEPSKWSVFLPVLSLDQVAFGYTGFLIAAATAEAASLSTRGAQNFITRICRVYETPCLGESMSHAFN